MERQRLPYGSLSLRKKAWVRESTAGKSFMLSVASAYFALPVNLLRYAWHGAGSAQGAASRRRPLYPRAPASKIAATPGTKPAPHPLPLPGGATLARAYEGREVSAKSPGRVRRSCHPAKIRHQSVARIRRHTPPSGIFSAGAVMPLTRLSEASRCCKCTNAIPEFHVCCVPGADVAASLKFDGYALEFLW